MCVRGTNSFGELFVECLIGPSLCLDELVYSPLSILACDQGHLLREQRGAKRSGGKESGEEAPRQ